MVGRLRYQKIFCLPDVSSKYSTAAVAPYKPAYPDLKY